jgi:hypothetical protein
MSQPVHVRPAPISTEPIASGPVACAAGAETTLKSITLRDGYVPYITSLAYYVNGASTLIKFRIYLGGRLLVNDFHDRTTILGEIGNPRELSRPIELTPTTTLEIRAYNGDATSFDCECDGEVSYHEKPL